MGTYSIKPPYYIRKYNTRVKNVCIENVFFYGIYLSRDNLIKYISKKKYECCVVLIKREIQIPERKMQRSLLCKILKQSCRNT